MYKFLTLLVLTVSLFFAITLFVTGCGDDVANIQPITTVTPAPTASATKIPLHNPPLKMVREGESGGFFSAFIDTINDGLKDGVTSWIGDNTTGRILDVIGSKLGLPGADGQLDEMNQKLTQIINQLNAIQSQLSALSTQLSITQVVLQNYISSTSLQQYITVITSKYDTTDPSGLMYFSQQGSQLDPNADPNAVIALQKSAATYVSTNTGVLETQIQGIHDAVCPGLGTLNGVLKDYCNQIILTSNNPNLSDPNNAMATYLLLETFFAQILNYQTKACVIVSEINNYNDTSGTAAGSYLNGTYKQFLKDEITQYEQTVNYLVMNMVDFRTSTNFVNDSQYYYTKSLAPDNTYLMVLARSRFFCAQIMNAYENDFGMYGAIVTPYDYSRGTGNPSTQLTLQFTGPVNFTSTVNAQNVLSRFPYTKWNNSSAHASPDNNWSFYDFSTFQNPNINGNYFDPNLPAGTYDVAIVNNSDTSSSFLNNTGNIGKVSILYYDPNNPSPNNASTTPTQTNTVKFAYFSGRWNWGWSRINCSPMTEWTLPSQNEVQVPDSPMEPVVKWPNPTYNNLGSGYYVLPTSDSSSYGDSLEIYMPSNNNNARTIAYQIQLPIIIDGAPGDTSTASAKLYCNNQVSGSFSASESKSSTAASYSLAFDSTNTLNYYSNDHNISFGQIYQQILNNSISTGSTHHITAYSYLYCEPYSKCTSGGTITMNWNMQIVYTNNYNIFQ